MANGGRKLVMGGTFFTNPKARGFKSHLMVIISDPAKNSDEIATVHVTSIQKGETYDASCTFTGGEHRNIWKPCFVKYDAARVVSVAEVGALYKAGMVHSADPVTPAVLKRIQDGALRSDRTPIRIRELLKEQGLV